jgi:uncharacterized membrane protein
MRKLYIAEWATIHLRTGNLNHEKLVALLLKNLCCYDTIGVVIEALMRLRIVHDERSFIIEEFVELLESQLEHYSEAKSL